MLVMGDKLMVANIGDSRAVLSRRGQAVAMSQDQKPTMFSEWERIQKAGGYIDEEGIASVALIWKQCQAPYLLLREKLTNSYCSSSSSSSSL